MLPKKAQSFKQTHQISKTNNYKLRAYLASFSWKYFLICSRCNSVLRMLQRFGSLLAALFACRIPVQTLLPPPSHTPVKRKHQNSPYCFHTFWVVALKRIWLLTKAFNLGWSFFVLYLWKSSYLMLWTCSCYERETNTKHWVPTGFKPLAHRLVSFTVVLWDVTQRGSVAWHPLKWLRRRLHTCRML